MIRRLIPTHTYMQHVKGSPPRESRAAYLTSLFAYMGLQTWFRLTQELGYHAPLLLLVHIIRVLLEKQQSFRCYLVCP